MTRFARKHPTFFGLAVLALAIPLALRLAAFSAVPAAPVASADLASTLIRAGLDPEALAAAGVSSNQAAAVVDDFGEAMSAEPTRLSAADASHAAAKVASDQLRRLIQSGRGSQEDVTSYQTAMSDLQAAEAARQGALDDWYEAGTASLSNAQLAVLATIKANRHWKLDIELLAQSRSEAEWVELRDALAHERIAPKYNEPVSQPVASFLADCRADAAVSTAKSSFVANATAVETAWKTAVN